MVRGHTWFRAQWNHMVRGAPLIQGPMESYGEGGTLDSGPNGILWWGGTLDLGPNRSADSHSFVTRESCFYNFTKVFNRTFWVFAKFSTKCLTEQRRGNLVGLEGKLRDTKECSIGEEATLSQFCVARGIDDALCSATQASGLQLLLITCPHLLCIQ